MTNRIIPDQAVDPVIAYLNAHFRPDAAADLLAAAQPLMAIAWDEGHLMGWNEATANTLPERDSLWRNPYRTTK